MHIQVSTAKKLVLFTKYTFIVFIFFLFLTKQNNIVAQQVGASLNLNLSSQTNFDPTLPQDGEIQWNNLITPGFMVYYTPNTSNKLTYQIDLGYQLKGSKERATTGILGSGIYTNEVLKNRFHNLVFRGSGQYNFQTKKIKPFLSLGLEVSYLFSDDLQSAKHPIIGSTYPYNIYNGFNKYTLGYVLGTGINTGYYKIHFQFVRDITPLLKKENLVVKSWIWSFKLDVPIYTSK